MYTEKRLEATLRCTIEVITEQDPSGQRYPIGIYSVLIETDKGWQDIGNFRTGATMPGVTLCQHLTWNHLDELFRRAK